MRPGERFMNEVDNDETGRYLRMAYSHVSEEEPERGVAAFGDAIHEAIMKPSVTSATF